MSVTSTCKVIQDTQDDKLDDELKAVDLEKTVHEERNEF